MIKLILNILLSTIATILYLFFLSSTNDMDPEFRPFMTLVGFCLFVLVLLELFRDLNNME